MENVKKNAKIAVKRKNALGRTTGICIWFFNNFWHMHLEKSRKPQETSKNLEVAKSLTKLSRSENPKIAWSQDTFFVMSLYTWNGDGWSKIDKVQ